MAVPASFAESNAILNPPEGANPDDIAPLSVFRGVYPNDVPFVISCWKLTKEDLAEINRTGRVWLTVLGITMPPVGVDGKSPFTPLVVTPTELPPL